MRLRRADICRNGFRWLGSAALLAFAPKCLLCVVGYAGIGAALGSRVPELCGVRPADSGGWPVTLTWAAAFAALGAIGIGAGWVRACAAFARGRGREANSLIPRGSVARRRSTSAH
jgi:hypothetical protein